LLIAHISDLHLNSFYNDSILRQINFLLKHISEKKVDHLVITGDITDNASEKDFEIFRRMLNKYGFLNGEKVSIIIGNHDIFGGVQKAEEIFAFPEKCSKVNYNRLLSNFVSYFPEAFDKCYYLSSNNFFPFAKKIGNTLLIGLNSIATYSKLNNPFGSNGEINASQFSETYDILKSAEKSIRYKIVMIHHHFNKIKPEAKSTFSNLWSRIEMQTMKLRNKKRLLSLFKEFNVDIVLHGHTHESKEYYRKEMRFLNAGASIKNQKNVLKVNFLNLNKGKIDTSIQTVNIPERFREEEYSSAKRQHLKLVNAALIT
jgi:3',5'-cyclic AMP phosphodiesterase CpdA